MDVNPITMEDIRDIHDTLTSDPVVIKFIFTEIIKILNIHSKICNIRHF